MAHDPVHVGLFVTCLVDLFRPSVGFATVDLLERAGCTVSVPSTQTCCGQPAYNAGDNADAKDIARRVIETFEGFDYVVAPSGSCAAMIARHYPELFHDDPDWGPRARRLASRTHELVSFLTDVRGVDTTGARYDGKVTYHDSCSGLRELGIRQQPRDLLAAIDGLELVELPGAEECCGFGGTFCVKYPEISTRMVTNKIKNIEQTGRRYASGGRSGMSAQHGRTLEARGCSGKGASRR